MKLEPDHKLFAGMITASVMIIVLVLLTGCTTTTSPDGSVTRSPDYNAWLTITEMIIQGVTPPPAFPVSK